MLVFLHLFFINNKLCFVVKFFPCALDSRNGFRSLNIRIFRYRIIRLQVGKVDVSNKTAKEIAAEKKEQEEIKVAREFFVIYY